MCEYSKSRTLWDRIPHMYGLRELDIVRWKSVMHKDGLNGIVQNRNHSCVNPAIAEHCGIEIGHAWIGVGSTPEVTRHCDCRHRACAGRPNVISIIGTGHVLDVPTSSR